MSSVLDRAHSIKPHFNSIIIIPTIYSSSFFLNSCIDLNSLLYKSSDFIIPKKFSITELSRQFPFRDMLCSIPCSVKAF